MAEGSKLMHKPFAPEILSPLSAQNKFSSETEPKTMRSGKVVVGESTKEPRVALEEKTMSNCATSTHDLDSSRCSSLKGLCEPTERASTEDVEKVVLKDNEAATVILDKRVGEVEKIVHDIGIHGEDFEKRIADEGNVLELLASRGQCPYICKLVSWSREGEKGFRIRTKWCSGGPLLTVRASMYMITKWWIQAARALAHCAEFGVVHNDVCPHNIWVQEDGSVCLGDFGISFYEGDESVDWYTSAGRYFYTPSDKKRTCKSDVFSLAVTIQDAFEIRRLDIPAICISVLDKCLAEDPSLRPTAQEVVDILYETFYFLF